MTTTAALTGSDTEVTAGTGTSIKTVTDGDGYHVQVILGDDVLDYGRKGSGGFQTVTVSSTSIALPSIPAWATKAMCRVLNAPINTLATGTPTAADTGGFPYFTNEVFVIGIGSTPLGTFRMIRRTSTDAIVVVEYFQ